MKTISSLGDSCFLSFLLKEYFGKDIQDKKLNYIQTFFNRCLIFNTDPDFDPSFKLIEKLNNLERIKNNIKLLTDEALQKPVIIISNEGMQIHRDDNLSIDKINEKILNINKTDIFLYYNKYNQNFDFCSNLYNILKNLNKNVKLIILQNFNNYNKPNIFNKDRLYIYEMCDSIKFIYYLLENKKDIKNILEKHLKQDHINYDYFIFYDKILYLITYEFKQKLIQLFENDIFQVLK